LYIENFRAQCHATSLSDTFCSVHFVAAIILFLDGGLQNDWWFQCAMPQGEVVVARFLQWPPGDLEDMSLDGVLLFGDGSQKMLAAITCWMALLMTWRHHGAECLQEQAVLGMIQSFLEISTIVKAMDARGGQLESVIDRIVQQNVAAKVQPISSFGWSAILRTTCASASLDDALTCYNEHPEVVARERDSSGAGAISLDNRKRQGVRNWMERTAEGAYAEVLRSTHDLTYQAGPFGEVFAYNNSFFLRSVSGLEALDLNSVDGPLPSEPFAEARPCFKICRSMFSVETACCPAFSKIA
jgi:hypothetical protein